MSTQQTVAERRESVEPRYGIIDCDVHPYFVNGLNDLMPYLSDAWRQRIGLHLSDTWARFVNGLQFRLPGNDLYVNCSMGIRGDAMVPGEVPASDPEHVARQLLDGYEIDRAVLLGGPMSGLGAMRDPDVAAAIAAAYNDWLCERWLSVDTRYRGSLLIAPQDPSKAAAEIDRVGDRPGIVQIHAPLLDILMGERHWYPIYEAADRHGLPIAVHPSATEAILQRAPTMGGVPTYYVEWHTALTQPNQSNVISLICQGVFERFPSLRYVIVEGGFSWAVDVLWRLDRDWSALRAEVPWVHKWPSEYLFENIRFTTQPFVEPKRREHLVAVLDILQGERTLLFSSDYPHWDFDDPRRALNLVPGEMRQRILADNAIEVYGDRLD
jgi:predicted TIM-barrel fold metal-dependent hydrolase